jgi:alkylated DNA repair dioxygenase AlkB
MEEARIKRVGFVNARYVQGDGGYVSRIILNSKADSWIDLYRKVRIQGDRAASFEELWSLQPEEPGFVNPLHKNQQTGKLIPVPRKHQAYLKPYYFSGMNHLPADMPEELAPFVQHANSLHYGDFNELLVNWYADGNNHICMHADDLSQYAHHPTYGYVIYSLTLWEEIGEPRTFRIKPIGGGNDRIDIPLDDGLLMIMGGAMQEHYKHGVPQTKNETGRRINITLRQFRD